MEIRSVRGSDYYVISPLINDWWGGRNMADMLPKLFFDVVRAHGRRVVRCVTSPVNKGSIAYHTRMGFMIEDGGKLVGGVPVHDGYDGPGQNRVLLLKYLN